MAVLSAVLSDYGLRPNPTYDLLASTMLSDYALCANPTYAQSKGSSMLRAGCVNHCGPFSVM